MHAAVCHAPGCHIEVRARKGDRNYGSGYCHEHYREMASVPALVLEGNALTVPGMATNRRSSRCSLTGCETPLLTEFNIRARSCDEHLEYFRYGHSLSADAYALASDDCITTTLRDFDDETDGLPLGVVEQLDAAECRTPTCGHARQPGRGYCRQCENIRSRVTVNRNLALEWERGAYVNRVDVRNAWMLEDTLFDGNGRILQDRSLAARFRQALSDGRLQPCVYTTHPAVMEVLTTPRLAYHHSYASRGLVNAYCQAPGAQHIYTTRLAALTELYDAAQAGQAAGRDRWRLCSRHRAGTGGYSRELTGYLYLLRRPSMAGPHLVLTDEKGRDLYDYQFGISNVPQKRLGHHIRTGGWDIVEVRVSPDGNDAHMTEAYFKDALMLLGIKYWALDENNEPMSGVTECFTQRDFGRRCGSLDSLAKFTDRALKASGWASGAAEALSQLTAADAVDFTPIDRRTGERVTRAA